MFSLGDREILQHKVATSFRFIFETPYQRLEGKVIAIEQGSECFDIVYEGRVLFEISKAEGFRL
jgi:hypothetical protein